LIIRRYLFREILSTLLILITLLLIIYISHRFMIYLIQASAGSLPTDFIFQLLGLKLLSDLMLILPLGCFLAVLLALGRLYKDNEMTALAACGVSIPIISIFVFSLIFAGFIALLSLFLAPWAQSQKDTLQLRLRNMAEVSGIAAGRFKEFNQGQGIFYVENINSETNIMSTIFVQVNLENKQVILVAEHGQQISEENESFLVLTDGHRYENRPGQLDYIITTFAEHRIKLPKRFNASEDENQKAVPTALLWQLPRALAHAEFQWRLSLPLTVILLALLAIPLSYTTPRQGQYAKIVTGILIYLIYSNVLNIAKKWVERGDIPPEIGLWWVHIILIIIIIILFKLPFLRNKLIST